MSNILEDIERKYFLNFCGYGISPVASVSVAMVLDYMLDIKSLREPFVINFPNKEGACVPITAGVMINLFFNDYVYQKNISAARNDLMPGRHIEVFDSVARIRRQSDKGLVVYFAQDAEYTLTPNTFPFISITGKTRLTKYVDFIKHKKNFLNRRNALSIIFEPAKADIIISPATFTSKLLLITGRGTLGKTKAAISGTRMFDETLSSILKEGQNLIIRQDLEDIKGQFEEQNSGKPERYCQMFKMAYERNKDSLGENEHIGLLINLIESGLMQTQEYLDTYYQFLEQLDENHPSDKIFRNLKEYHPGLKNALPEGLKAVLINDIYIYDRYRNTIDGLLHSGIPVICLCDTIFDSRDSIDFYRNWLESNRAARRFGWTRKKIVHISGLIKHRSNFIDSDFWNLMLNYAAQKISWEVAGDRGIENLYTELSRRVSATEGADRLRDSWWRFLVPAYYIIKNTPGSINTPSQLLSLFEISADNALSDETGNDFRTFTNMLRDYKQNLKPSPRNYTVFRQHIGQIGGYNYEIPGGATEKKHSSELHSGIKSVFFTGFPYREWIGRDLMRAVREFCIPDIYIALWPQEYRATHQYIRTRILAGFFPDHYSGGINFPESLLTADLKAFEDETDLWLTPEADFESLSADNKSDVIIPSELYFNVMHKSYIADPGTDEAYAMKCDIVYFDNQDLLYLPHSSGLLVTRQDSTRGIEKCYFNELRENDVVYQYRLSRSDLRDLARQNKTVSGAFSITEKWKSAVKTLYQSCDNNLFNLEIYCDEIKSLQGLSGNPSRQNLQRWLFDEDIISPEQDNLKVLMAAAGDTDSAAFIKETLAASQQIRGFTISIAAQIKRAIAGSLSKQTESTIAGTVTVYGKKITVETRKIIALEKSDILINYGDTRKIIK